MDTYDNTILERIRRGGPCHIYFFPVYPNVKPHASVKLVDGICQVKIGCTDPTRKYGGKLSRSSALSLGNSNLNGKSLLTIPGPPDVEGLAHLKWRHLSVPDYLGREREMFSYTQEFKTWVSWMKGQLKQAGF